MNAPFDTSGPTGGPSNQDNLVQNFRDGTYKVFGFALAPFLTPFSIYSFVNDRWLMGVLTALTISLSLINSVVIMRHGHRKFSYWTVYIPILAAFSWGIVTVSPMVAFWCYPVAIVTLFVSSRSEGRLMTALGIAVILPCADNAMDTQAFVRFAPTYVMGCYFVDLVVGLLDRLQKRLTDLAITDPLTGAYNRRHFDAVLADALEQQRRGLASVSLLTFDVDHFKAINDRFGHAAGDQVLTRLVQEVGQRIRSIDTLFRIGGEEFTIIARGIPESAAIEFGESLRRHIAGANLLDAQPVTVSVGVAQFLTDGDREDLLRRADSNLYEAKKRGRNQVWPSSADKQGAVSLTG